MKEKEYYEGKRIKITTYESMINAYIYKETFDGNLIGHENKLYFTLNEDIFS